MTKITRRRRRVFEFEAVQWTGDNEADLIKFTDHSFYAIDPEDRDDDPDATGSVCTSEGGAWVAIHPGTWITKDATGRIATISAEDFDATYEQEAAPSEPSATETPDERDSGSRDDRTSTGLSDALVAAALKAWETARGVDGLSRLEAMRAALAAVISYVRQQERQRAEQLALRWLAPPIGAEPIEVLQGFMDALEGEPRG